MPAIYDSLVSHLKKSGYGAGAVYAIATAAMQKAGNFKPGTRTLTKQGTRRNKMGSRTRRARRRRGVAY